MDAVVLLTHVAVDACSSALCLACERARNSPLLPGLSSLPSGKAAITAQLSPLYGTSACSIVSECGYGNQTHLYGLLQAAPSNLLLEAVMIFHGTIDTKCLIRRPLAPSMAGFNDISL